MGLPSGNEAAADHTWMRHRQTRDHGKLCLLPTHVLLLPDSTGAALSTAVLSASNNSLCSQHLSCLPRTCVLLLLDTGGAAFNAAVLLGISPGTWRMRWPSRPSSCNSHVSISAEE